MGDGFKTNSQSEVKKRKRLVDKVNRTSSGRCKKRKQKVFLKFPESKQATQKNVEERANPKHQLPKRKNQSMTQVKSTNKSTTTSNFQSANQYLIPSYWRQIPSFYGKIIKLISQRLVLRLDPSVKRNLCKACGQTLVPGLSCRIRINSKPTQHVTVTCFKCGVWRKFGVGDEDYVLYCERRGESLVV